MRNFEIGNFICRHICEGTSEDVKLSFETGEDTLAVSITASTARPRFVELRWDFLTEGRPWVLGDAWERSYGDLRFMKWPECAERPMPWYFAAAEGEETMCLGVKTQPDAFVCFTYDRGGVTAKIDCRNGDRGVRLDGRTLKLCTFVFRRYHKPPIDSLREFCGALCDDPILPKEKIYGGNNWYYAYGKSSFRDIVRDAKLQAELAEGIENRPFMVVDDGWMINPTKGPYVPNESFGDMKALADEIKALGVRPGIWIRPLDDLSGELTDDTRILRDNKRYYLDPTNETVQAHLRREIGQIRGWGYELLKHDFSTYDLFGDWGKDMSDTITTHCGWHFGDETKTNAQVALDLYRLIREACGDMLIIGCNTVSHLCAGLAHIYRTDDDTSGKEWARTRKMGVNTLAFRLAQNGAFYLVDADCVGILDDNIPWEKNRQWLDVLSKSDTALFTSCAELNDEQKADVARAYREIQKDHCIKPLDIYDNLIPREWEIDGSTVAYSWD